MIGFIGMKNAHEDLQVVLLIIDSVSLLSFAILEFIALIINKNKGKNNKLLIHDTIILATKPSNQTKFELIPSSSSLEKKAYPIYIMIILCGVIGMILSILYDSIDLRFVLQRLYNSICFLYYFIDLGYIEDIDEEKNK